MSRKRRVKRVKRPLARRRYRRKKKVVKRKAPVKKKQRRRTQKGSNARWFFPFGDKAKKEGESFW